MYLVLGAETHDRERLLVLPGSPPLPYNLWKGEPAPRASRGFPSESSEAELEKVVRPPEGWLGAASQERERVRGELHGRLQVEAAAKGLALPVLPEDRVAGSVLTVWFTPC